MPDSNRKEFYKLIRQLGMLSFIPTVLVSGPLAGFLLGKWLDHQFHFGQGPTIFLAAAGFVAGAIESYRIIKRVSTEDRRESQK